MATTSTRPSHLTSGFSSCDLRPVPMERYQTKPVSEWSKKEVKAWLESLDLKQYARAFRKHEMCGSRLAGLSRDDLRAMNVTKVGHIKKITSWLRDSAALHNGYAPPPTATLSPTSSSSAVTTSGKFMSTMTRRYSFGGGDSPVPPPLVQSSSPSSVVGATLVQSMARLSPSRHTSSTLSTTSSSASSASSPPSPIRRTKGPHSSSPTTTTTTGSPLRQSSMDIVLRRETRSASVPENLHSQQFFDVTVADDVKFYSPETSGESLCLGPESGVPLPRRGSGIRGRPRARRSNSVPDCNSSYARLYPSVYVWVKLVFVDDISIMRFKRRTLTIKRLQREILRIHQCQLRLRWVDSDGDCIEIKTTEFLAYALEDWQRRFDQGQQRMIRIEAFKRA